jgi:hypothetical protein
MKNLKSTAAIWLAIFLGIVVCRILWIAATSQNSRCRWQIDYTTSLGTTRLGVTAYVDTFRIEGTCVVLPSGERICGTYQIARNPSYQSR